jgi:hypothetical protein
VTATISLSFGGFMSLGIRFYEVSVFADKVLHYCGVYGRSVHDSSYLALAEQEDEEAADLFRKE